MFRTITIAGYISAQGEYVRDDNDGRITISTGSQLLTGRPVVGPTAPLVQTRDTLPAQ